MGSFQPNESITVDLREDLQALGNQIFLGDLVSEDQSYFIYQIIYCFSNDAIHDGKRRGRISLALCLRARVEEFTRP